MLGDLDDRQRAVSEWPGPLGPAGVGSLVGMVRLKVLERPLAGGDGGLSTCLHGSYACICSGLGRYRVKGRWGLEDPHSSSVGWTRKEEHLSCPQLLCHLGLFEALWLLQPRRNFPHSSAHLLDPCEPVSFVLPQPRPGNTDQETEEQQQFRNIFRQIAGDVSTSRPPPRVLLLH